ncbi:hypothetical protein FNE67_28585 [Klebsiella pneumoniae]|nr:hypothetical protein [Salmonella enterica subsp. enterica serovar Enteritidis]EDQ2348221.1 hypothetical protein [Salmonella enterica]KAB1688716.1 hypothetical protein FNE66_28255 [Klebsiella pneumoniae]ECM4634295.1 hypothetical protein [Salmonella enterica subsp. enterica serovar Enteritidis]ECM4896237.1 hypothetical protein [Salmonella enterica subsp. enterica serovar Enteritidis]
MRKSRTPGSVRGVSGNGYPYRDIAVMVRLASFTGSLLYVVLLQLPTNAIYSVCWLSAFSVSPVTGRVAAG